MNNQSKEIWPLVWHMRLQIFQTKWCHNSVVLLWVIIVLRRHSIRKLNAFTFSKNKSHTCCWPLVVNAGSKLDIQHCRKGLKFVSHWNHRTKIIPPDLYIIRLKWKVISALLFHCLESCCHSDHCMCPCAKDKITSLVFLHGVSPKLAVCITWDMFTVEIGGSSSVSSSAASLQRPATNQDKGVMALWGVRWTLGGTVPQRSMDDLKTEDGVLKEMQPDRWL